MMSYLKDPWVLGSVLGLTAIALASGLLAAGWFGLRRLTRRTGEHLAARERAHEAQPPIAPAKTGAPEPAVIATSQDTRTTPGSAVQQFDRLVEGIGGYGGQCATPPHVLAPTTAFSDQITAMRKRIAGLESSVAFLAGGPLSADEVDAHLDEVVNAIVAMGGHQRGISHMLRQVLATDRAASRRYRALRRYLQVGPTEDDESWGLWCISRHQPDDLKVSALALHFPDEVEEQAIASGKADWGPDVDAMVDSLEAPREIPDAGGGL